MEDTSFDWLNLRGKTNEHESKNGVHSPLLGSVSPAPVVSFGFGGNRPNEPGILDRYHQPTYQQYGDRPQSSPNHFQANTSKPVFNFEDTSKHARSTSSDQIDHFAKQDLKYNSDNTPNRGHKQRTNSFESLVLSDDEDLSIPLSLTAQELTLQESKTYVRWYSDILARTNSRTISLNEVFSFLNNFKLSTYTKNGIRKIFHKIANSINIGEFFALLRLISHTLLGKEPKRSLIKIKAPIPSPPSILSKKRLNDDEEGEEVVPVVIEEKPLDLDGFTQFLLTGERPNDLPKKKKSKKSVTFQDQIVTDVHDASFGISPAPSPRPDEIDFSLSMDQLLNRMKNQRPSNQDEKELLKDMESQINHFQHLNSVDSASIGGVPSSLHSLQSTDQLLQPNMTGPAQMAQYNSSEFLKPNMTGPAQMAQFYNLNAREENNVSPLQPNVTGPEDMAKLFAPSINNMENKPTVSLQSFTSQMTGNTLSNTLQNTSPGNQGIYSTSSLDRPVPPIPTPRSRSLSSPVHTLSSDQYQTPVRNGLTLPPRSPIGTSPSNYSRVPPPPPPSRKRQSSLGSQPPSLPPKVELNGHNQGFDYHNNNPYSNQSNGQSYFSQLENPNNQQTYSNSIYENSGSNDSTANILDDLKALQEEVDKIRNMTGGF